MKLKDGKATATLTELKNKIGDVFAMVDKAGEVTITSYNKPAYRILKVDRVFAGTEDVEAEIQQLKATEKQAIEPEPFRHTQHQSTHQPPAAVTPEPINLPAAEPVITPVPANIEVQIYKPEVVNVPAAPTGIPAITPAESTKYARTITPQKPQEEKQQGIWGDVSEKDLWNRANSRETAWVQTVKNLF